jgi:hypothetical protein
MMYADRNVPGADLCGVTLDEGGVNGVGKRELDEVLCRVVFHLVGFEGS